MQQRVLGPLVVAAMLLFLSGAMARQTNVLRPAMNLSALKRQCVAYYNSGLYVRDIAVVDAQAERYIERRREVPRAALVLDIDETSLSNWPIMKQLDFGYSPALWSAWFARKECLAIAPTLRLYAHAKRLHFALFFITGRREVDRANTIADLEVAGYHGWNDLFLPPNDYKDPSIATFKTAARRIITQRGYHIVANVGDQESDLRGGFADRGFKLPNPMYIVP